MKIPDIPNFEILGRFTIFGGRFGWFCVVSTGFGAFWLVPGFRKYTVLRAISVSNFTSMENCLISKKLLDSNLFQFCSPQRRAESEMK